MALVYSTSVLEIKLKPRGYTYNGPVIFDWCQVMQILIQNSKSRPISLRDYVENLLQHTPLISAVEFREKNKSFFVIVLAFQPKNLLLNH